MHVRHVLGSAGVPPVPVVAHAGTGTRRGPACGCRALPGTLPRDESGEGQQAAGYHQDGPEQAKGGPAEANVRNAEEQHPGADKSCPEQPACRGQERAVEPHPGGIGQPNQRDAGQGKRRGDVVAAHGAALQVEIAFERNSE
jgi:hypothetical protein